MSVTSSVDETVKKEPLKRVIPVTSFDDDEYSKPVDNLVVSSSSHQHDHEQDDGFVKAVLETHLAAQEVFDKAQRDREHVAFAAALLHTHQLSEKVFQQMRDDKEKETLEMQKQMVMFSEQAQQLHEKLEHLFANIKREPELPNDELIRPVPSPKPSGPLNAVFEELKSKTAVIDAEDPVPTGSDMELLAVPVASKAIHESNPTTPESVRKQSSSSSKLMLEELKKAINRQVQASEDDATPTIIAPSSISKSSEASPVAGNESDETHDN